MKKWKLRIAALTAAAAVLAFFGVMSATAGHAGQARSSKTALRFQLSFFPNAQHVGFLVAANRGYYGAAGLNVKVVPGGPTVNPTLALAQGNVDVAQVDFPEFLQAVAKGAPMTFIGLTYQQDPLTYVSLKKTPLASPADLKGKKFGVQQAGPLDAELQALLAKVGLSTSDITTVSIGFSIEDLVNGKCDVFPSRIFFHPAQFEDANIPYPGGLNVLDPNKYGVGLATQGLAVNNAYLKKNPHAVVAFLRASLRGWRQAIGNPAQVLGDIAKFLPPGANNPKDNLVDTKYTNTIVTHSANGKLYRKILQIDMPYLNRTQDILLKYKVVKKKLILAKYVNTALMARAAAR
jgi:NitT/TauT family transport system substrate-binding protein